MKFFDLIQPMAAAKLPIPDDIYAIPESHVPSQLLLSSIAVKVMVAYEVLVSNDE